MLRQALLLMLLLALCSAFYIAKDTSAAGEMDTPEAKEIGLPRPPSMTDEELVGLMKARAMALFDNMMGRMAADVGAEPGKEPSFEDWAAWSDANQAIFDDLSVFDPLPADNQKIA